MNATDNNPISQRRDDEALAWATRLDGAGLTSTEQAALANWLAADAAHEWRLAHFRQFFAQMHGTLPVLAAEGLLPVEPVATSGARRPVFWKWLATGLVAASVALGALWLGQRPQTVATQLAQRTSMKLTDGSQVQLNARSRLAVRIGSDERRVRLEEGEAFFAVAKEAGRTFVVETPAGAVRVTGTQFNVRTGTGGALQVTVLEGSVAVRPDGGKSPAREIALRPHDQLTVGGGSVELRRLEGETAADTVAWREGKAVFNDTPLSEALAAFAGYHNLRVTVTPEAAGLRLGGRFTLDDFSQFLASLEDTLPVQVLRADDRVRIIPR